MAGFSVKQIKAVLSEYGMPVEGLDKAAEEICSRHNTALDSIKEERDGYKTDAETLATVKQELDTLKAQKDDGYKDRYEKEHADFEKYKADVAKKETQKAKEAAFVEVLKDAGITAPKSVEKILKYTDLSGETYELSDDGKFKDAKSILKSVKEEWPEHVTTERKVGVDTKTPPDNGGSGTLTTKAEIYAKDEHGRYKLSASERQKALSELLKNQEN